MDLERLKDYFHPDDIEWRIQSSGYANGKPWARALAYITNRAIMERLDDVCGMENWQNEFSDAPCGGVLCGISILCDGRRVTKWDGAENTAIEEVKGGLSAAMKRAGSQWGIGRYLYKFPPCYVQFGDEGEHAVKIKVDGKDKWFKWFMPEIPGWAYPGYQPDQDEKAEFARLLQSKYYDGKRKTVKEWWVGLKTEQQVEKGLEHMKSQVNKYVGKHE